MKTQATHSARNPKGAGKTVLVVDDEESVRRLLRVILSRAGHRVIEASCGREALAVFDGGFDLLITDVVMPGMDGVELARLIVLQQPEIGLLFISGHCDEGTVSLCRSIGAGHFLQKPFTAQVLQEKVLRILNPASGELSPEYLPAF